jgi:hypothetical protein
MDLNIIKKRINYIIILSIIKNRVFLKKKLYEIYLYNVFLMILI